MIKTIIMIIIVILTGAVESQAYHLLMKRVLLSWSSGKDSAWALHKLRGDAEIELCAMVTTLNSAFDRVAMHGTRRTVVEAQARAAGLPLWTVPLPWPCTNEIYEQRMAEVCARAVAEGIQAVAFGDLFLPDVRAYRERQLHGTGLEPLFPLWQIPTDRLAREMIAGELRARLSCVDLPPGVDPCGERGEFHTCVYAGPMFSAPLAIETGEIVNRDGFVFADFEELSEQPA
jgi:diphthamide synthase (EF-2-diphthine--ammonia ligase)